MSLEMKWREKIDRADNPRELSFPPKRKQFTNKQINACRRRKHTGIYLVFFTKQNLIKMCCMDLKDSWKYFFFEKQI